MSPDLPSLLAIDGLSDVTNITSSPEGGEIALAVKGDGTVWVIKAGKVESQISGLSDITDAIPGRVSGYGLALRRDGRVVRWPFYTTDRQLNTEVTPEVVLISR